MTSSGRALVSGGSIAGLSAAYWLARTGWDVTVLERSPAFRTGGQNVDVRGAAREVLDRMGLTDDVRAANTTETGTVIVDEHGATVVRLPDDDSGEGATAELEVLRGDLAEVIRNALPDSVRFRFGDAIVAVDEDGSDGRPVTVRTRSGATVQAELLVVAEGVRSDTRDLLFTVERRRLGITMEFGTIPRIPSDDDTWRWYNAVGGRQVHLRPDAHGTTRAMLAYTNDDGVVPDRRDRYAGAGWQTERVLDGFEHSEDVYVDDLTQIVAPTWHRGSVVLLGDAAWCVTPMGGGGSSLALTGGYVLAASLAAQDADRAFAAYEEWMRPLVDRIQTMPPGIKRFAYPQTRAGLAAQRVAHHVLTSRPVAPLMARLTHTADADQPLPALDVTR
ncbi:FAD-dependent monooxygenase [Curtobacterium pusillum]|uniref:FAD-dependent monooxygenase n=1 Tax=Curtobacterium pusillum TaxID=69373 RepID=UPI00119FAC07|nr:FAD-dependent monooxygenase [Curtobacterium pusillum]